MSDNVFDESVLRFSVYYISINNRAVEAAEINQDENYILEEIVMKIVNLVDENGKEIKVDKSNVNEFVIRNAVEMTKKSLPKFAGYIPTGYGASVEQYTMNDFTDKILKRLEKKGIFDENSSVPQTTKTTAFAAINAAQLIYNMCLEQEIKNNIYTLFYENEIGKTLQPNAYDDSMKKVKETFEKINDISMNKQFVDSIRKVFKENSNTRGEMFSFLDQSLRYVNEISKKGLETGYDYEDVFEDKVMERLLDKEKTLPIHEAVSEYVEPLTNGMEFSISYGEGDIKPHEFLEKYKNDPDTFADNLTAEEKTWVEKTYRLLEGNVSGKQVANQVGTDRVELTDFKSDGVQIVSKQELKEATDHTKLEAKIIAEILSGKQVTSQPKNSQKPPVEINPTVVCTKPEGILDWIIEFLKNFISFETEKDKVKALNDSLSKEKNEEDLKADRQKMGFDDLLGKTFDKVITPPAKEAEENVVQISHPPMGRE